MFTTRKKYRPFAGPFDPCPPIQMKTYVTPPNVYIPFQPPNLPQFPLHEALKRGTLWEIFYDPYYGPYEKKKKGDGL